ncbi:MAG: bis-aminopropyl spermidine synthase family protein [Candidatus Bathyarchaeia archaeon]
MNRYKEKILLQLKAKEKTIWEILKEWPYSMEEFVETMNLLYKNGLIKTNGKTISLKNNGEKALGNINLLMDFDEVKCFECQGKTVRFSGKWLKVLEEFKSIAKHRPKISLDYYQGYMRPEDTISRIMFMHAHGDVWKKSIVIVGDDDLISLGLGISSLPSRITVLEADPRYREFINHVSKAKGLDIEFIEYDVRKPLSKDLLNKFDVFITDPLETIQGIKTFLSRGVSCLKDKGVGYFGLSRLDASSKKWFKIESMILKMSFIITDIIKGFSYYPTSEEAYEEGPFVKKLKFKIPIPSNTDWYHSYLFRIEALSKPIPLIKWNKKSRFRYYDNEDLIYPR